MGLIYKWQCWFINYIWFNNIAPNGCEKSQSSFVSNGYPHTQALLLILLMEGLVCENMSCDPAWVRPWRYLLSYASFHNDRAWCKNLSIRSLDQTPLSNSRRSSPGCYHYCHGPTQTIPWLTSNKKQSNWTLIQLASRNWHLSSITQFVTSGTQAWNTFGSRGVWSSEYGGYGLVLGPHGVTFRPLW